MIKLVHICPLLCDVEVQLSLRKEIAKNEDKEAKRPPAGKSSGLEPYRIKLIYGVKPFTAGWRGSTYIRNENLG